MEFLTEFGQPLKTINESDYSFYDIESLKEYLFGCPVISNGIIKRLKTFSRFLMRIMTHLPINCLLTAMTSHQE